MEQNGKQWYEGVLNIPEAQMGVWAIRHRLVPADTPLPRKNLRTAFTAGHTVKPIVLNHESRWHELTEDGGVWMTDLPIEQWQHDQVIKKMRGHVLVGGLGLGYATVALASRRSVKRVTVVEKSNEVCELVWNHLPQSLMGKLSIVNDDLFSYLQETKNHFDWGFYDIWQSDGEGTFHQVVVPLYRASVGKVRHIENWNEDVMRGQLFHGIQNRWLYLNLPPEGRDVLETGTFKAPTVEQLATPQGNIWWDWALPYWQWVAKEKPDYDRGLQVGAYYCRYYRGQSLDDLDIIMKIIAVL